jgi:hypothetical protein
MIDYKLLFERLAVHPPDSDSRSNICTRLSSFAIHAERLGEPLEDWLEAATQMALSRSPVDDDRYTDKDGETPPGRYGTSVLRELELKTRYRSWPEEAFHNAGMAQLVARGLVWEIGYNRSAPPSMQATMKTLAGHKASIRYFVAMRKPNVLQFHLRRSS